MRETVLFVDDDQLILAYAADIFQKKGIGIVTAGSGEEALRIFAEREVAVMVTDNCMPGIGGLALLEQAGKVSPDTVKIMMTAYTDVSTVLTAINRGEVFRFVPKPWKPPVMLKAVREAIRRYRLLIGVKKEEEFVFYSLAQTIELKDHLTKGHCDRVAAYALQIAEALELDAGMQKDICYGSWLHDCGKIGVPESILNAPRALTEEEFTIVKKHPVWGMEVARKANLSPAVQDILLYHHERYDGTGYPTGLAGDDIPLEARIVSIADCYDALCTVRPYRAALAPKKAQDIIAGQRGTAFDPVILDLFISSVIDQAALRHPLEVGINGRIALEQPAPRQSRVLHRAE